MGGNVAALYAGIRPTRLRLLINLEGFGLPRSPAERVVGRYAEWLDALRQPQLQRTYRSVDELATVLARRNPRLTIDKARFIATAWTKHASDGRYELATDPKHRWPNPVLYRRDEAEECWRNVLAPVQMLLGEFSEYRGSLGEDGSDERFLSIYRNLDLRTLPGVGHMMHHENPAAVAVATRAFIEQHT
jgi:pimeloyl-ACP methyl ester carboxylesterase